VTVRAGLRYQIAKAFAAMALAMMVLSIAGSYVFYALASSFAPDMLSSTWVPSRAELVWIVVTVAAGVLLSIGVGVALSKRILTPLNSVAAHLREIANGNLDARVRLDARASAETRELAQDVNALAERLQHAVREQEFWNAAVAHELRTPVTVLLGRLQGLADGVFTADRATLDGLLRQANGLSRLVDDLRVISLGESRHLELSIEPVDVARVLEDVRELYAQRLMGTGFDLQIRCDVPCPVDCDPQRVRQALIALMDNAMTHATPGVLLLYAGREDDDVIVGVSDAGPGIAPDALARVFQPFWRGDASRARTRGGSGLGLAVVEAIAHAHGGQAGARIAVSGGTDVFLRWPALGMTPAA